MTSAWFATLAGMCTATLILACKGGAGAVASTPPDPASRAAEALANSDFARCIDAATAALQGEDRPATRLLRSACERKSARYIDALRDAEHVLAQGIHASDPDLIARARPAVEELLADLPHVVFEVPAGTEVSELAFDDKPLPADAAGKEFAIDPGAHRVRARGVVGGVPGEMLASYDVVARDVVTVKVALAR